MQNVDVKTDFVSQVDFIVFRFQQPMAIFRVTVNYFDFQVLVEVVMKWSVLWNIMSCKKKKVKLSP
jgi:hypothetical protein